MKKVSRFMLVRIPLLLLIMLALAVQEVGAESPVDFSRDIRPILASKCFSCHGPDEGSREAGLRLDRREDALVLLESGVAAIVPHQAQQSELVARVDSEDEYLVMPPGETGKTLSAQEKSLLRRWIDQGAPYTSHWAFQSLQQPEIPQVASSAKRQNPIDAFVQKRLLEAGLEPAPAADPRVLVRRLYLDLTGLPPTAAEVEAFIADQNPAAYEKLVDRLLASPHFGERWGRHWLDLARYADSNGYLGDELRHQAYRYRDWVIKAINDDMPYDQFTIEQIAGDLLENPSTDQRIATAFHTNVMVNTEAGADRELDRVIQTVDRLSTVGTTWLGLTIGCAECHTHKYDPITHREFYQMYAFFNNLQTDNLVVGEVKPKPEDEKTKREREDKLQAIEKQLQELTAAGEAAGLQALQRNLETLAQPKSARAEPDSEALEHWLADLSNEGKKLAKDYETLALKRPQATAIIAPAIREASRVRATHIHHRGDFRQPGDEVSPGTPAFLPPLQPRSERADRLDLARWLVREDNPLTARTAVNHLWQHLFGQGLVDTEDNFGTTGSEPSHPELLDWLALQLIEKNWSRKELIRLIVLSSTYQQSSQLTPLLLERDPQNKLLARQSRYRLEGEIIRDVALAASGLLSKKIGGPSIRPPMNSRITQISRNQDWTVSKGEDKYRRGMYILFRRATPFPMLTTFDVPNSTVTCPARERSNSPLQALALLNDPVFFECAQHLGKILATAESAETADWITLAVQRTLSRNPSPEELVRLQQLYQEVVALLEKTSEEEIQALISTPVDSISPREQAARVIVARSLMNLEEFMTRE